MSPQLRRFLPLLLIGFLAIVILPQVLRSNKGDKPLSAKNRGALTFDAADRLDRAEAASLARRGRYTANLAELVLADRALAADLSVPLTIELDVGPDARSYLARISSDVVSLVRARRGRTLAASSCRVLKSGSGVSCPQPAGTTTAATTTAP